MWLLQTRALLVDAYRELNAKKLFWAVMAISAFIMGGIACLGVYEGGMSVLWIDFPNGILNATVTPPEVFYKLAFITFAIPIWLAWGATILALISTAGMIPDFVAGGSIEMSLSKPISRVRLFLTKYLTGLLFVFAQVLVFAIGSFLVIGIRGGSWEPGLFLAVPLMTIFFSYLFCVCALVGLLTRSTITALLVTMIFWLALFAVNIADGIVLTFDTQAKLTVQRHEERLTAFQSLTEQRDEALERYRAAMQDIGLGDRFNQPQPAEDNADTEPPAENNPDTNTEPGPDTTNELGSVVAGLWLPTAPNDDTELRRLRRDVEALQERLARTERHIENTVKPGLEKSKESAENWAKWQTRVYTIKTALPKTAETIELLRRWVIDAADLPSPPEEEQTADEDTRALFGGNAPPSGLQVNTNSEEFQTALRERYDARSVQWVIGTSLLFQLVILTLACLIFARRDF